MAACPCFGGFAYRRNGVLGYFDRLLCIHINPCYLKKQRSRAMYNGYVLVFFAIYFFSESKISMIRSNSSSLLKGMLIFPFPFSEQVSCTLVLKNPERCCFSILNSSGSLARFGVIFWFRSLRLLPRSAISRSLLLCERSIRVPESLRIF